MRPELWLRDERIQHEEGHVNNMKLNENFLHCHRQSVSCSDKEWETKLECWETASSKARATGLVLPTEPTRKRFGNKGTIGQYDSLHFLSENFEMQMQTKCRLQELQEFAGHLQRMFPVPAPPPAPQVYRPHRVVCDRAGNTDCNEERSSCNTLPHLLLL
jgi:hypothetical protein